MSTTIKQAIDGFLLNCKVEGKSWGTIDCYATKLKGFLWYATNYDWPKGGGKSNVGNSNLGGGIPFGGRS